MKTIEVKKATIKIILLSILIGSLTLFTLEHFGQFSYLASDGGSGRDEYGRIKMVEYISGRTKVSSIYYSTFFGETVESGGNGFDVADLNFQSSFYTYQNKLFYVTESFKKDIKYGLLFSFIAFLILWTFSNFKFKLK